MFLASQMFSLDVLRPFHVIFGQIVDARVHLERLEMVAEEALVTSDAIKLDGYNKMTVRHVKAVNHFKTVQELINDTLAGLGEKLNRNLKDDNVMRAVPDDLMKCTKSDTPFEDPTERICDEQYSSRLYLI